MKLAALTNQVLIKQLAFSITEGASSDVKNQMAALGIELKKAGEDVNDEEVQAAILSALIDVDGDLSKIDVSDIEKVGREIKESRSYLIKETDILHGIEAVGTLLGNSAFIHTLAQGIENITGSRVNERELQQKLLKLSNNIKKASGLPAKAMEKAFAWSAKKLGLSSFGQKIAGLSGVLVLVITLLSLGIALFPSISSTLLLVLSITSMVGKSAEIAKLAKEIYKSFQDYQKTT